MLAMVEFEWGADGALGKLDRDAYMRLRERVQQLNLPEWKEDAEKRPSHWLHGNMLLDLATDAPILFNAGIEFKIKSFKGTRLESGVRGERHQHLHVAISNVSLLQIDEVEFLTSPDVHDLQRSLNDGWRVLAVCPTTVEDGTADFFMGRARRPGSQS